MNELDPEKISRLPFKDRVDIYKNASLIDVSDGLEWMIHDADELADFIFGMLRFQTQARFPILGIRGKVYMQGGKSINDKYQHREILNALGADKNEIQFATGIESIAFEESDPHLELTGLGKSEYLKEGEILRMLLARDTDLWVRGTSMPEQEDAHGLLENIFGGIKGVTVNTPPYWKKR